MKHLTILLFLIMMACQSKEIKYEYANNSKRVIGDAFHSLWILNLYTKNEKAIRDFKNGIQEYTLEGTVYSTKFELYYDDYMMRKYSITMKATCMPSFSLNEYYKTMNLLILEKYGNHFIEKTRKWAKADFHKAGFVDEE